MMLVKYDKVFGCSGAVVGRATAPPLTRLYMTNQAVWQFAQQSGECPCY